MHTYAMCNAYYGACFNYISKETISQYNNKNMTFYWIHFFVLFSDFCISITFVTQNQIET